MKKFWAVIGLLVFALLLQACDSAESSATSDDSQVVYCTDGNKADEPGCVPDPTKSPPGDDVWSDEDTDESDVYVEPSVGCTKLQIIAGEWWDIHYGDHVNINMTDMSTTCEVKTEGTGVQIPLVGTELPLEYHDDKYDIYMYEDEKYLIIEVFIYEQHASTQTLTR